MNGMPSLGLPQRPFLDQTLHTMLRPLHNVLAALGLRPATTTTADGATAELSALVRSFIADYEAWNDTAQQQSRAAPRQSQAARDAMDAAVRAYGEIIARYCPPGYRHQGIAFGSEASHRSASEEILGVDTEGAHRVVRTRMTKDMAGLPITSLYEYHFTPAPGGGWHLARLLVVIDDEKLETL